MRRFSALFLALSAGALPLAAQSGRLPTPESVLGFKPGADRKLPTWKQVTDYYTALDRASPRVSLRTLGKTVLGRPFLVAFIADSATIANLDRYRDIQHKLADPRLRAAGERARLVEQGKAVVLITSSIHSTEVGGHLTPFVLADRLARGETDEARSILANTIVMLVPSQNPDGMDIVGDWYRSTLDTPAEGSGPPELYHHYTGHDNNRTGYAFTQPETRVRDRFALRPVVSADRQRHPSAGRECRPDLHPAVHGSGRAQHRSDPHRGHQLARCGDGLADVRRGEDRRGHQCVVRPVDPSPAVLLTTTASGS
ncbi:MAG: M14 family zinc carboxypeptidase [Gemmatimonadales bacterium]